MVATLYELLASHETNRDRFDRLRACVERGDLTPFVGTGMSRDSDYPLWSDFVRNMGKRALIPNEIVSQPPFSIYGGRARGERLFGKDGLS